MKITTSVILTAVLMAGSLAACSGGKSPSGSDGHGQVLVSVGDSSLMLSDVVRLIPRGISPEDSARMFHSIVDTWVRDLVLVDVAEKNLADPAAIDRMVDAYRTDLIVEAYLSTMEEGAGKKVSDARIREYYDAHHASMILDEPLVKGALIKIGEGAQDIDNLRRWMSRFDGESLDNIERTGLRQASRYEYFKEDWLEWSAVAELIPYRFFDADAFLKSTKMFETEEGGNIYLLRISDYIPSGTEMPFEYAARRIEEILRSGDASGYRARLIADIYSRRIKDGFLRPGLYNPVKGEIISDEKNKKQNNHIK